jgi:hypothetical protein
MTLHRRYRGRFSDALKIHHVSLSSSKLLWCLQALDGKARATRHPGALRAPTD